MRDLLHPVPVSALSTDVIVGVPVQLSVAVAEPVGKIVGLQPRPEAAGQNVNDGGVVSTVHVNV